MIWRKEENDILKRLWIRQDMDRFLIAKVLTNRSPSAIAKHASDLQLKKESKIRIDYERLEAVELFEI